MNLIKNNITKENIFFLLILFIPFFYVIGSLLVNLIVVLVIFFTLINSENQILLNLLNKYKIHIFIILLIVLINIFNAETKFFSLKKFLLYLRFLLFFLCYIILISKLPDKKLKIITKLYLLLIIFVVIDSLIQLFFGKDLFGYEYFHPYNRITGPFGNEMIVGFYILNFGILTLALLNNFTQINLFSNFMILLCLFIFILLTGERTSFLTGFYFLFFLFIFSKKKKFVFYTTLSIFLISIITISNIDFLKNKYPIYNILQNSFNLEKIENNKTNDSIVKNQNIIEVTGNFIPVQKWKGHFERSIEIFQKNIFFGSGFRSYRIVCIDYQQKFFNSLNIHKCSTHPHNFHLEIISNNGITGYFIFLIFIFFIIRIFFREKYYENFGLCIIFCLILSFVIPFKTTGSIFTTNYAFVFWYLIGNYFFLIKKKLKN